MPKSKETIPLTTNGPDDSSSNNTESRNGGDEQLSADRRSDSDASATGIDGSSSESGARRRVDALGDDELPIGDGGYKKRRKRSAIVGEESLRIGEQRGGSRRSRTDSDSGDGSARTEEDSTSDRGLLPREVALDSLGKSKEKKEKFVPQTSFSSEFIAEGFGIIFHGAAVLFRDDEWKLPEDDAKELADRTQKWVRQGSKNVAAFEKKLAKYEPMIMLILGLFAVILPRIIHTRDKRRALSSPPKETRTGSANGKTASAPPVQASNVVASSRSNNGRSVDLGENNGPVSARELPFRRQDWREIPGVDD